MKEILFRKMKKLLTNCTDMAKIKLKTSVLHQNTQQSLFQGEAQFLTGGDGRNFPSQVRELSPA